MRNRRLHDSLRAFALDAARTLSADLEAGAEVDRPDQRLDGVGEDRGLLPASRRLLALAETDVASEPDRAGVSIFM